MSDLDDTASGALLAAPKTGRRSRRCLAAPSGYHGRFMPRDKWICVWCGRDVDTPETSQLSLKPPPEPKRA